MDGECVGCGQLGNWCKCDEQPQIICCVYPKAYASDAKHSMLWFSDMDTAQRIADGFSRKTSTDHSVFIRGLTDGYAVEQIADSVFVRYEDDPKSMRSQLISTVKDMLTL